MRGSFGATNGSACYCLQGFVWDPTQLKCVCDYNQNFYEFNGICWNCYSLPNTNSFATASGCICNNGLTWISSLNACACPSGYAVVGGNCISCTQAVFSLPSGVTVAGCTACSFSQGFTTINSICYSCSGLSLTTGAATSSGCTCSNSSLIWIPSLFSCACQFKNTFYYTNLSNSQVSCYLCTQNICSCGGNISIYYDTGVCVVCTGILYSTGLYYNGGCQCYSGYAWSSTYPYQCYCSYTQGAYLNGSTCMNCSSLPATGVINSSGCSYCDPNGGYLYLPSLDICILCSGKKYSNGKSTVAGCGCSVGVWSPTLFECVSSACNVSYCSNCYVNGTCQTCINGYMINTTTM